MSLSEFQLARPRTLPDVLAFLSDQADNVRILAGGTDLLPSMRQRLFAPEHVLDLRRISELRGIRQTGKGIEIGALTTLREIEHSPMLAKNYPVLTEAAKTVASPLIRNMSTIGGNLLLDTRCNYYDQNYEWRRGINFCLKKDGDVCWVAPGSKKCWAVQSSDLVPLMVAIGARVKLVSTLGERMVDAAKLYNDDGIDYLHKRPDELLTEIHLPPVMGWRATYKKLRRRGAFDFPVLGVAARVDLDESGAVKDAKLILGGIAPAPVEVKEAEKVLVGNPLNQETIEAAAEASYIKARPLDNTDFVMNWRKQMARPFVVRALEELRG